MYRFGRGFCGDPHDAEDVAQVTLAALARSLRDFRGESSLTTWAYTVARNACTRHRRRGAQAPARLESLDAGTPGRARAHSRSRTRARIPTGRSSARNCATRCNAPSRRCRPRSARCSCCATSRDCPRSRWGRPCGSRSARSSHGSTAPASPCANCSRRTRRTRGAGPRCPDTARLVSRYLEGELDAEACARLERHVKSCPDCGATCAALKGVLVTCRSWRGEKLPEPIRTSLRAGHPAGGHRGSGGILTAAATRSDRGPDPGGTHVQSLEARPPRVPEDRRPGRVLVGARGAGALRRPDARAGRAARFRPRRPRPPTRRRPRRTPEVGEDARALAGIIERRCGRHLSKEQLESIARDFDGDLKALKRMREVKLGNGDEPDFTFRA